MAITSPVRIRVVRQAKVRIRLIPKMASVDGASAYEVAVENGFVGTEVEWLATLGGIPGPDGPPGPTGPEGPPSTVPGPAGSDGVDGIDGIDGINGTNGAPGTNGTNGAAATIAVGTVITVNPGDPATITNVGTSAAAVFNFEIPKGADGAGAGSVTSVGLTVPTGLDVSGSPITGAGTLAVTYASGYTGYTSAEASKLAGVASGATANSGTVTSVAITLPTGLQVSGSPITTSGTFAITFASGYSIPTTTKQGQWNTAYGWGNHASAGYLTTSAAASAYQPLDSDLTAIAALTTTAGGRGLLTLGDPNADRIVFWDDSAGVFTHLTIGTGLTISTTTMDLSSGAQASLALADSALQPAAIGTTIQPYDALLSSTMGVVSVSAARTLGLTDSGKIILHPSADTTARIWTIPANGTVAFPVGTTIALRNQNAAGVITLNITTDTLRVVGTGQTGSRALAANGYATLVKETTTEWSISGIGLS